MREALECSGDLKLSDRIYGMYRMGRVREGVRDWAERSFMVLRMTKKGGLFPKLRSGRERSVPQAIL